VTLLPLDEAKGLVRGVAGPKYKVGPRCSNPSCTNSPRGRRALADSAHHIWPRSFLRKQPQSWVELPDGRVIGNLTALCADCHRDVNGGIGGYRAAIRLGVNDLRLWWCRVAGNNGAMAFEPIEPLDPQPPTREALVVSPANTESDSCPTCGQPRTRRRTPPAADRRRVRKTWPVQVPADVEENGAEVLDSFTEDLAPLLGVNPDDNGRYTSGRYYVLVPALYFAQINRDDFIQTITGKGG